MAAASLLVCMPQNRPGARRATIQTRCSRRENSIVGPAEMKRAGGRASERKTHLPKTRTPSSGLGPPPHRSDFSMTPGLSCSSLHLYKVQPALDTLEHLRSTCELVKLFTGCVAAVAACDDAMACLLEQSTRSHPLIKIIMMIIVIIILPAILTSPKELRTDLGSAKP